MASWSLGGALRGMFAKPTIDEDTWDDLETALYTADFGPDLTEQVIEDLRAQAERYRTTDPKDLQRQLREILEERLERLDPTLTLSARPAVILVVGVNGVGKTTTIGKLAKFIGDRGRSVVIGAADTFRAAAVDQVATWAERAGAQLVRPQQEGQDPASVAYQTIEFARQQGTEIVIVDTAGRLQTKAGLMDELAKIRRSVEKALGPDSAIAEVLLVLDATTGQNGRRRDRTGSRRRRRSSTRPASPVSCSPSSMARRRAASSWPSRSAPASPSSSSARARASGTSAASAPSRSSRSCSLSGPRRGTWRRAPGS